MKKRNNGIEYSIKPPKISHIHLLLRLAAYSIFNSSNCVKGKTVAMYISLFIFK